MPSSYACARLLLGAVLTAIWSAPLAVAAQQPAPPDPDTATQLVSRDGSGHPTIQAIRLRGGLTVDGVLDEAIYAAVAPLADFIQADPAEGASATERTEVWVLYDERQIYVSVRCWESQPDRVFATDMRRDGRNLGQQDNFAFLLDTFRDGRNGYVFTLNAVGGRADGQTTNERQYNGDWNPVWESSARRFEGGWIVESAIPFKSLRYGPGRVQTWGFNLRRVNRWKNEVSFLTPMPIAFSALPGRGLFQASRAAALVGLQVPPGSRNLEIKPYVVSDLNTDVTTSPVVSNEAGAQAGGDVKYGITQNLTADLTVNTDFAQVEADEQQINLTRFSLFFPEKRDFFLENQGLFAFGGASLSDTTNSDTPILFYSRRVGLAQGRVVPIDAGGRLTGRIGRTSVGVLNIQSGDEPAASAVETNFSVLRLKRDLLRRSSVGLLATSRSVGQTGSGSNQVYGVDGAFGFFDNLTINTYWAQSRSAGVDGDEGSYRGQIDYAGDRYGLQVERLVVGRGFNPEVGYLRRADIERTFAQGRFSPRPRRNRIVRRYSYSASYLYVENRAGRVDMRAADGEFGAEFHNGDEFTAAYNTTYEFVPVSFPIASTLTVSPGAYDSGTVRATYALGIQRRLSGTISVERGALYGGHKTALGFSRGRFTVGPQLSIEPTISLNWIRLASQAQRVALSGSRVIYSVRPNLFVSGLVQVSTDAHAVSTNLRMRWEYSPGSELFVVYNEQRDTFGSRRADLENRAVIVKVNRLLRF